MNRRTILGFATGTLALISSARADLVVTTVAVSGQPAPQTESSTVFSTSVLYPFFSPYIGANGDVSFSATLAGPQTPFRSSAVYAGPPGAIQLVARQGDPAPGSTTFDGGFGFIPIGATGQVAFTSSIPTTTPGDLPGGLWLGTRGNLAKVALTGENPPGTPAGVTWGQKDNNFPIGVPAVTATNRIVFGSDLAGTGVDATNNYGLWAGTPGSLQKVARTGDVAPDTAGALYASLGVRTMNANGTVAFRAALGQTGAVTGDNDTGFWAGAPGDVHLLVREGDSAPDTNGASFGDFGPLRVVQNNASQYAFRAQTVGGDTTASNVLGIWSGTAGDLHKVLRTGEPAPGFADGTALANFGREPLIDHTGRLAIYAEFTGPAITADNNRGVYLGDAGNLSLIARTGQHAPGAPAAATFSSFNNVVLNAAGDALLMAYLANNGANSTGLWYYSAAAGQLLPLVVAGDGLTLAAGDTRTVQSIAPLTDSGLEDGAPTSFNDARQFVFQATFTDASQGVFVASVPEPSAVALLAVAAALLPRRRRRRSVSDPAPQRPARS